MLQQLIAEYVVREYINISIYLLRKDNINFAFVSTAPAHILQSLLKTPSGSIYFKCHCRSGRRREAYRRRWFLYKTIYLHRASVKQELKLLLGNNYYNVNLTPDRTLLQTSVLKIGS